MFAPHAQPLLHGRHVAPLCPRTLVVLLHQLRLVAHQAQRLGAEAKDYDWGRSAYLTDPDGRLVELQ